MKITANSYYSDPKFFHDSVAGFHFDANVSGNLEVSRESSAPKCRHKAFVGNIIHVHGTVIKKWASEAKIIRNDMRQIKKMENITHENYSTFKTNGNKAKKLLCTISLAHDLEVSPVKKAQLSKLYLSLEAPYLHNNVISRQYKYANSDKKIEFPHWKGSL